MGGPTRVKPRIRFSGFWRQGDGAGFGDYRSHAKGATARIGPVASTMPIAQTPEIGAITGEEAAALTGFAPVAHDSGTLRGKRSIAGGRRVLRHVMFHAALVAAHHDPCLKPFADRLRKAGKPHKAIITAVAGKLATIANGLCKSRKEWAAPTT